MNDQTRYLFLLRFILPLVDVLIINIIFLFIAFNVSDSAQLTFLGSNNNHLIVCNLIWFVCAGNFGLYRVAGEKKMEQVYRATWKTFASHLFLYTLYLLVHKEDHLAPFLVFVFYTLLSITFVINRLIGTSIHYLAVERFQLIREVAVIGSNQTAQRLLDHFKLERNFKFYGVLGDNECVFYDQLKIVSSGVAQKLSEAAQAGVKDVFVTLVPDKMLDAHDLIMEADKNGLRLKFIPDFGTHQFNSYNLNYLGNKFPIISIRTEPLEEMDKRFKKRFFDLVFATLVCVFILWWLIPLIGLIIKLDSKGPVFFLQKRAGRNNEHFMVYKFRTMRVVEKEDQYQQAKKGDVRITKVGKFLRKSSLDEMPQFINVILGNMSVVGPRPHPLKLNDQFQSIIDKYMVRHFVKPGITGWAQVHGLRGETKDVVDMENRVKYDIYYLENWTAMLDVKIVFMTIINMIRGEENAY